MKRLNIRILIPFLLLSSLPKIGIAQNELIDTVRLEIYDNIEPLPGVSARIKSSNQIYEAVTDLKGNALIAIPENFDKVILSFLGPYFEFTVYSPVDFIKINLYSKSIIYYYKGKKQKKIKFKQGF